MDIHRTVANARTTVSSYPRLRRSLSSAAFCLATMASVVAVASARGSGPEVAPRRVRVACPEALADGSIHDAGQREILAGLAATLKWDGGYGVPTACHRQVRLFCGPDVDGDGDREAVVEVGWWQGIEAGACSDLRAPEDHWLVSYTFLASQHASTWRAVAPLGVGIDGDELPQTQTRQSAFFVRLPRGGLAVRTEWSSVSSESGCRVGGYQVFALRAGALRKVDGGDLSLKCFLCDCDKR